MKYTTTTVSRRVVMVKVKAKPAAAKWPPPVSRNDSSIQSVKAAVPMLFNRSSTRPVMLAAPTLWWENWKINTLIISFVVLLLAALYFLLAKESSPAENRSRKIESLTISAPTTINIRPMGMSSTRSSSFSGPGQMSDGSTGGSVGGSEISASRRGEAANYAITSIGADQAAFDSRSKLVLPADVSGACNVGESGLQDLAGCLTRNGARTEK